MEGDDSKVYNLMSSDDDGNVCRDRHTGFANIQNSFKSKDLMSFRYKAFQWDPTNSEVRPISQIFKFIKKII